jgi:arylsulfatase A-like enzyme
MVTRLDSDVGRILDLLAELGIDDETIVFVCSDHGPPQQWVDEPFDASGGLTGGKRDLTEGGIRTPMLVRWPEQVPAGEVCDAPWYYADLLPTFAELAGRWPDPGVQAATEADGVSVLPTLLGDDQPLDERYLYWEFDDDGWGQAARYGDWKAIRPGVGEPVQLYDLDADPAEEHDLADDHPDVVTRFEWFLDTAHEPSKHWPAR